MCIPEKVTPASCLVSSWKFSAVGTISWEPVKKGPRSFLCGDHRSTLHKVSGRQKEVSTVRGRQREVYILSSRHHEWSTLWVVGIMSGRQLDRSTLHICQVINSTFLGRVDWSTLLWVVMNLKWPSTSTGQLYISRVDFWSTGRVDFWSTGWVDFWLTGWVDFWLTDWVDFWSTGRVDFWSTLHFCTIL